MMKNSSENRPDAGFPHINAPFAELVNGANEPAGEGSKLSNENSEPVGNRLFFQMPDNPSDLTDSPTIVKSRSLSKKIRERQTRDRAISGSEPEKGIPSINAKIQSNLSTPVRSRANSSSINHTEATSESVSMSLPLPLALNWTAGHPAQSNAIGTTATDTDVSTDTIKPRPNESSAHPTLASLNHVPNAGVVGGANARSTPSPSLLPPTSAHAVPIIQPLLHNPKPIHTAGPSLGTERSAPKSLEKLNAADHIPAGGATSQPTSGRQHGNHNRNVTLSLAQPTNKLSALSLSPATSSAKARASSSSTSTILSLHGLQSAAMVGERQFLIALDTVPKTVTVEDDNDRIVQERLLEAKAMDRKNTSGAVMHQFSLWNKAQPASAKATVEPTEKSAPASVLHSSNAPAEEVVLTNATRAGGSKLTAISHNMNFGEAQIIPQKKPPKLRGPKAALASHSEPRQLAALTSSGAGGNALESTGGMSSSSTPGGTHTGGTPCEESKTTTQSSAGGGWDDEYNSDLDTPAETPKPDGTDSIPSFTASGSLATALRMKVDVAKHSLVATNSDGTLGSDGAPAEKHVYVTPEKAPLSVDRTRSKSGERVIPTMASDSADREGGSDGWDSDGFIEEDEELQRLSANRPQSTDGNAPYDRPSEADAAAAAAIKSMTQSGPAAFATQPARRAMEAARTAEEKHADEVSASKMALRRATTSGDSRHFVDKFEHLISAGAGLEGSQSLKSMTSRSASECNITFEASELHSQSAKSSSSKYQVLRNLRSNKSSQRNLDRLELSAQLSITGSTISSPGDADAQGVAHKGEEAQPPVASFSILQPAAQDPNEQEGLHTEREDEDASPTLSEFSDAEEPLELHQEQQRQRQALSPLKVESMTETLEVLRERTSSEGNQIDLADQESPLRWRKGEVIGEGTFGKVYKGMNEKTGELLAIKQLCLVDGTSVEVDSLCKEINVMWNLEHENIVRYMGTSKTERYLYIILEYVTGGSIAGMISQFGPFNEKLMRRFTLHIMSGVEYLHSKGIIHRDIKGANILVSDAGIAKLADFGCSKQLAGMCTASIEESMLAIRGSVPWMAPEVIKQSGHGRASDIWSVGATVIEMATGKPPWSEFTNSLAALFHVATSKSPPPMPPDASPLLADFLSRCMVIEPSQRATALELLQDCEFLTGAVSVSAAVSARARVDSHS